MATIEFYEDDAAISVIEGRDEIWLVPSHTSPGDLFISVTDYEAQVESGIFLSAEGAEAIIEYITAFRKAIEVVAEKYAEEDEDGEGVEDEQ